jgi:CRP-like cAMP-binding protein
MAKDPKIERLASIRLFRDADDAALEVLAQAADEVDVKAGHILIEQGRHHRAIYVLQEGAACVEIDGDVIAEVPKGEFLGELSYFNHRPASATVRTTEDSRVLTIPFNRFEQVIEDNPKFLRAMAAELAERLEATDLRLKALTSKNS